MKTKTLLQIRIIAGFLLFAPLLAQGQENKFVVNQEPKTAQEMHDMFMKKSKAKSTAAWITLGSGVFLAGVGFATIDYDNGFATGSVIGAGLVVIGGASTLVSAPFFISAGSNKRKAKLALKGETVSSGFYGNTNNYSLSISIPF